jgi:molybdenum cofactor synthesis domain-containing protein
MFTARVITVSDRSYRGEREDLGGPLVRDILTGAGYTVDRIVVVPDEEAEIRRALIDAADNKVALIVTTGGTGFAPRDVTPEATAAVCQRLVPGIPEAMRAASLAITPRAMLSRAAAGIRDGSLIVNLPGSPKGARENLEAVLPALEHGLEILRGRPMDCAVKTP